MVLCGSLERMEGVWLNGNAGMENDSKTGWSMDCYMAASINSGSSAFFQPKLEVSAPSIEVYIAGCCSGVPVILTKTIHISPRRKCPRHATLDAIPEEEEEEEEVGKEHSKSCNGLFRQPINGLDFRTSTKCIPFTRSNGLDFRTCTKCIPFKTL
ncbi:hypothetical protein RchiOBHm_Chr1g0357481 [Rosa chinensis]|uniref:Uncharacterized protein n=2 Tax=Rosa chinensis TaxID=74649 RepID=A0A2P6SHX2_ROSCH|nr:hypothetical protein RchiOBHm_Chr1g0357481 [Rosa chinensis]